MTEILSIVFEMDVYTAVNNSLDNHAGVIHKFKGHHHSIGFVMFAIQYATPA